MSMNKTTSTNQTKTNTAQTQRSAKSENASSRQASVRKQDQLSFLENIKGLESGVPFIASNFEASQTTQRDNASGGTFTSGSAQAQFNGQVAEDPSAAMLSNTIIQKLLRDPALQNMAFSIQNKHGRVDVEAAIKNGHMRCALSSNSEKLKRRMHNARDQIISRLGGHLRMPIELDIEE